MTSAVKNECFINGIVYKCRTCFDPGQTIYSLAEEVNKTKTWKEFLKDFMKLQINDEDLLPNTICNKCLEKVKSIHNFLLQIEYVNKKYSELLETFNDPLHEGVLNDIDSLTNCLTLDLPLEQDIQKIKQEEIFTKPCYIALDDINKLLPNNNQTTYWKNEDTDEEDPFSKSNDDGFNSNSEHLQEEESFKTTDDKSKTRSKRRRKAVTYKEGDEEEETTKKRYNKPINYKEGEEETPKKKPKQVVKQPTSGEPDEDDIVLKPNVCPYCSRTFRYKACKDEHVRCVHEKVKPYKCSKCEKTFSSKQCVKSHELSHTDDFPFQCEFCQKRFRVISKLRIHREIHTTKPELLCPFCKRAQKSIEDMEEHVKSHNNKQCNMCGKLFNRNSRLNDHYNAVHLKLRPYKCQYCELGFGDRKTRRMHERKHHPKDVMLNKTKFDSTKTINELIKETELIIE
ncbi:uncharacterized protein ACRADG_007732 [Cochliomyia hominivorax]